MARDDMTYEEALHAMGSGVAMEHAIGIGDGTPKQLRIGINSAMVNDLALARLLIAKGIITVEEYSEAVRVAMVEEVVRYERRLSDRLGKSVTLE